MIVAIKKVAAANHIRNLMSKWRIDRDAYLIWKARYLRDKQQALGAQVIAHNLMNVLSHYFNMIKTHLRDDEKITLKPLNLFKRLIPPSPRGHALPPRVVYSSFT